MADGAAAEGPGAGPGVPGGWSAGALSSTSALADRLAPALAAAMAAAREDVRRAVVESAGGPVRGGAAWAVTAPAYSQVSHPFVARVLSHLLLDLLVGAVAPYLLPFLPLIEWLLSAIPAVFGHLGVFGVTPPPGLDTFLRSAGAVVALARTPREQLSPAALAGLAALAPTEDPRG